MKWFSNRPRLYIVLALLVLVAISLLIRIALPFGHIFESSGVKYASNDSYSFMRMVDNWVHNFPHVTSVDVYRIYPGTPPVYGFSFFNWIIAFIAWLLGFGSPSQHFVDVIGVTLPAILGALCIIPAYFIGKTLFNRWAGLLAAGLVAIMPGEFLGRSILGFTDYHVAETLFSMTAVMFIMMAVKAASETKFTYDNFRKKDYRPAVKPLLFALFGGIFLGLYLLTWQGAALFVFIITLYFVVQFIIDHLKGQSSDYLAMIGFVLFFVAFIICIPFSQPLFIILGLIISALAPAALSVISRFMARANWKTYIFPISVVVLAAGLVGILYAATPSSVHAIMDRFRFVFLPSGATATTTMEMQHLLSPSGSFTTSLAWGNFTTSFFLIRGWPIPGFSFIALVILIWLYIKNRASDRNFMFLFIWTVVILLATLVQRRFAYYLVVNLSLLTGYLAWQFIGIAGVNKLTLQAAKPPFPAKQDKKKPRKKAVFSIYHINVILAIIIVFFTVYFFNITKAKEVASAVYFAPTDAWEASLKWMRENTPDPFENPDTYYEVIKPAVSGPSYTYPDSAYGVTAWWDYGYWIERTARRLPSCNPAQAPGPIQKVANMFLSTDNTTYHEIRSELDSSYIMVDYATVLSKFLAIATWADKDSSEYVGTYYISDNSTIKAVQLLYPAYYQSFIVRLYNFNGAAVTENKPLVITWEVKSDNSGQSYRLITDAQEFDTYYAAQTYIAAQSGKNCAVVGRDPFVSPVPLQAVPDYELVYGSDPSINDPDASSANVSEVKIFHYTGTD